MTEAQTLIREILAAPVIPKWRKTAIAVVIGTSVPTISRLAAGTQPDTCSKGMDELRKLHKIVTKGTK